MVTVALHVGKSLKVQDCGPRRTDSTEACEPEESYREWTPFGANSPPIFFLFFTGTDLSGGRIEQVAAVNNEVPRMIGGFVTRESIANTVAFDANFGLPTIREL